MKINISSIKQLIDEVIKSGRYEEIMRNGAEKYNIQQLSLELISPSIILQNMLNNQQTDSKAEGLQEQTQNRVTDPNCITWGHCHYKTFSWVCVCLSFYSQKDISAFGEAELQFLRRVFPRRSHQFLTYHLLTLLKGNPSVKKAWSKEENQMIIQLMRQNQGKFQWRFVSYELYIRSSGQYFRPRQKCRQQWINHLDPKLKKGKWTLQQDILLFRSVLNYGRKWSQISKIFKSLRTQHMVKNRYNSLAQKSEKRWGRRKTSDERILTQLEQIHQGRMKDELRQKRQQEQVQKNQKQPLVVQNQESLQPEDSVVDQQLNPIWTMFAQEDLPNQNLISPNLRIMDDDSCLIWEGDLFSILS